MGWATGAWAEGAWAGTAWAVQSAPVEVPDVTGETQASATSTLEGAGFVVQVQTAFSDSIAEGLVISQVPAGGQSANSGSTVVITVSLGVQPASSGAGRSKRRRRYLVEVDGREFEVASIDEARDVLERAKALAPEAAEQQVRREIKRARRRGRGEIQVNLPEIETDSIVLEPLVSRANEEIRQIYQRIAREAELRELIRVKLFEEDEEDAIISLLLH